LWIYGDLKSQDVEQKSFLRVFGKTKNNPKRKKSRLFSESFHGDADRRVLFKFCEIWPTESR